MDISKVRELVKLVQDSGIAELEISEKDTTIRIQKNSDGPPFATVVAPAAAQMPTPVAVAPVEAAVLPEVDATRAKWKDVRSPIVGTYYQAAGPDSSPFVSVGSSVVAGQTLCIIEAMKVMNEIDAEFGGTIKEIIMTDGSPVEAEAVLFMIEPN